jgi:hypothetical protein
MAAETYLLIVRDEDEARAGSNATALADVMREIDGVMGVDRGKKVDASTMDLGAIVSIVATSGATLAIAQGIAAWLRARRSVTLTVEKSSDTESLKAAVGGVDPDTALRIVELIRGT